jgi:hypothetical protein
VPVGRNGNRLVRKTINGDGVQDSLYSVLLEVYLQGGVKDTKCRKVAKKEFDIFKTFAYSNCSLPDGVEETRFYIAPIYSQVVLLEVSGILSVRNRL